MLRHGIIADRQPASVVIMALFSALGGLVADFADTLETDERLWIAIARIEAFHDGAVEASDASERNTPQRMRFRRRTARAAALEAFARLTALTLVTKKLLARTMCSTVKRLDLRQATYV
jgi:hypothetical protein